MGWRACAHLDLNIVFGPLCVCDSSVHSYVCVCALISNEVGRETTGSQELKVVWYQQRVLKEYQGVVRVQLISQ